MYYGTLLYNGCWIRLFRWYTNSGIKIILKREIYSLQPNWQQISYLYIIFSKKRIFMKGNVNPLHSIISN